MATATIKTAAASDEARAVAVVHWRSAQTLRRHHPSEPHWYLPIIGVDPVHHGKGMVAP
jgi:hypothetical protein